MSTCGCKFVCGDVAESDDAADAVCKGLAMPKREPLVKVVLVDRRAAGEPDE